jgi:hypothetical protein
VYNIIVQNNIAELGLGQESQTSEEAQQFPIFHDEGDWIVVDGETGDVESGRFIIDTCVAEQAGAWKEWEVLLNLSKDKAVVIPEEDGGYGDLSSAYTPAGEVYRLWEPREDPRGEKAEQVHKFIVERSKSGIPADQLDAEVNDCISKVREGIEE